MGQEENKPELKPFEETAFWGLGIVCAFIALIISAQSGVAFLVFCLMLIAGILFSASRTIEEQAHKIEALKRK